MIGTDTTCLTQDAILNYFGQKPCPSTMSANEQFACADNNTKVYQLFLNSGLQYMPCVTQADLPDLSAPQVYAPSLTFTPGNFVVKPGDTWIVQLSGAPPNAPIQIAGGKDGNLVSQNGGLTDILGGKQLSSQVIDSQVGNLFL